MAVLLHLLHYHHLHLLFLVQSFILNLRLGFLANHFLHRPFPFLPDWFYWLLDHLCFYSAQQLDLFAWCVRLSRLLSQFSNALKIIAHSFIHSFAHWRCCWDVNTDSKVKSKDRSLQAEAEEKWCSIQLIKTCSCLSLVAFVKCCLVLEQTLLVCTI